MTVMKDRWGNKLHEITCPSCGKTAIILMRATYCSVSCSKRGKKRPNMTGVNHPKWVQSPSYGSAHQRVRIYRGRADHCEHCGLSDPDVIYDWAFNNEGDTGNPADYLPLCRKCHAKFDYVLHPRGVRIAQAKLTDEIVRECRARWMMGESQRSLAREFGISQFAMHAALSGKTWKHV